MNHSTNHPIIPNSQEYVHEIKYVSIHSDDIDCLKYPNKSDFIIELPEDYYNIESIQLCAWTFPDNMYIFSKLQYNVTISFNINNPYNPGDFMNTDPLLNIIFVALYAHVTTDFIITIDSGNYTQSQLATELTNRFNGIVTSYLIDYITTNSPSLLPLFNITGYNQFVIVYNQVSQRLWFGNKSSEFILTNNSSIYDLNITSNCINTRTLPSFSNWGLPAYLGFTRIPSTCTQSINNVLPRFYYGDVNPGDNGFWLIPDIQYIGASVYYLEAPRTLDIIGHLYFYMEIAGLNFIDETIPFNVSAFTTHTNETNGIVNASFAKILISNILVNSTWTYDEPKLKVFNPPLERLRKLKIKLRYHNGTLVDFNNNSYTFTLEMTTFRSQNTKKYKIYTPMAIEYK